MDVTRAAQSVLDSWEAFVQSGIPPQSSNPTPDRAILEQVLETVFEASFLQEEGRTLVFRLALQSSDRFRAVDGPPHGLHRLLFTAPRAFTAHELRRLTPAVDYDRGMIGLSVSAAGQLQIWGIIQSGLSWLEQFR